MVCRDAVALMTNYLEGHVALRDRMRIEDHLSACEHCAEYLAQLRLTIDAAGQAPVDALDDAALDAFVAIYRDWRSSA